MSNKDDWPEDKPIPLDHPLAPELIRKSVIEMMEPGAKLYRAPVDGTPEGYEYWLIDADGELIESFWLE